MVLACAALLGTSSAASFQAAKARRHNELTLAGLRPGRDTLQKAVRSLGQPNSNNGDSSTPTWEFRSQNSYVFLSLNCDAKGTIQTIRVFQVSPSGVDVEGASPWPITRLFTGRGVGIGGESVQVLELYGNPDSRSPSTKGGQPLELLYYAFDWAGPDVPQVMQVVCTPEQGGQAGRVVEITLAASSL
jgi:hypothetical protein